MRTHTHAGGHDYFDMLSPVVSPDGELLAYGINTDGSETYTLCALY